MLDCLVGGRLWKLDSTHIDLRFGEREAGMVRRLRVQIVGIMAVICFCETDLAIRSLELLSDDRFGADWIRVHLRNLEMATLPQNFVNRSTNAA
jgi:hypothetical protein